MVVTTATTHHHHDHYHSNASTASQYCSSSRVTELVRYLKNNFKAEKGGSCKAEKILARTSRILVPEYGDDVWKKHFERRQKNLEHGFFTPQHYPYHSLGDIALDTGQLVFDVFKEHLPEKHKLPGISLGVSKKVQENAESPPPDIQLQPFQRPSEGSKTNVNRAAVASAGFLHIKQQLQDAEEILTAVKAGQTFDKCVKELEQARKSLEDSIHTHLSSLAILPPVSRGKIYSRYGTMGKATVPVKSALSMRLIMTPSPAIMNDDDEMDMMKMSYYRSRKMLLRKLEAIHALLCCIHNVKSRDLRSRVPLSHDTVRAYTKKDVILDQNGRPAISRPHRLANAAGHTHHMEAIHSIETLSPHGHHGTGAHHSTHHHHHHHHHHHLHPPSSIHHGTGSSRHHHSDSHHSGGTDNPLSILRATTPTHAWRKFRTTFGSRHPKERDREHHIATWDDLLHAGASEKQGHDKHTALGPGQHRFSVLPNPTNQRHGLFSHIVSHYRNYRRHDHHQEKQPYWLAEGVTVPDKVKKTTTQGSCSQGDKHTEEDDDDIESPVEGLRTEFDKVQSKMTRDVLTDLERMERERCKTFIQKFMALKLSPLFEKELRDMRKATAQHTNGQEMEFDVKPSKWYIDLQTECNHLVGTYDSDINDIMKKLYKFSFEDAKSIPSGKERLCLIVMSVAADELMTIHMQLALYFVLEHILNAPPEFFTNWLMHRKLPIVIVHT